MSVASARTFAPASSESALDQNHEVWMEQDGHLDAQRERLEELKHELHLGKEKLQLIAAVSALIAGFSVVALIEININESMPPTLLTVWTLLSCVLITLHLFATMIAVCILPTLALMDRMSAKDPHLLNHYSFYRVFVEVAWFCSMGAGIFLFLAELVVVVWMQVGGDVQVAAISATVLAAPVFAIFIFIAIKLNRKEASFLNDIVQRRQNLVESKIGRLAGHAAGLMNFVGALDNSSIHSASSLVPHNKDVIV